MYIYKKRVYIVSNETDFLKKDKFKLLEGICVENQFKKSFNFVMSEGWWCVPKNFEKTSYIFFYLQLPNSNLNDITIKVFENLLFHKQSIYLVMYDKDFKFKKIQKIEDLILLKMKILNVDDLKHNEGLNRRYQNFQASNETTDTFKTNRVIQYLIDENLLEKIYIERLFANHILSGHLNTMPINLDAIMYKNNKLVVIEIKFKYPSKQNTFGINIGQANILKYLIQIGFEVFHYIAINPSHNEDIGIFEIQHSSNLKQNLFWYYKQLIESDFETEFSVAPSKTSVDGKSRQKFININATTFKIQLVQGQPLNVLPFTREYELTPCKKCRGPQKVVYNNKKFFLGCVNYRDCNK